MLLRLEEMAHAKNNPNMVMPLADESSSVTSDDPSVTPSEPSEGRPPSVNVARPMGLENVSHSNSKSKSESPKNGVIPRAMATNADEVVVRGHLSSNSSDSNAGNPCMPLPLLLPSRL